MSSSRRKHRTPRGCTPFIRHSVDGQWGQERSSPEASRCDRNVFDVVVPVKLQIATKTVPLSAIEETWDAPGKPRIVFTIPQ